MWLFVPNSNVPGGQPGTGLNFASSNHPILQTYVDICISGCLEFSREFAVEFILSTIGWDGPWLNDREVPRRPWVFCPAFKAIDDILNETIPEHFKNRMLPEELTWLIEQDAGMNDESASPGLGRNRLKSQQLSSEIHY